MTTNALASSDFKVRISDRGLGPNVPQRIGRVLWLPMLVMALMAFPVGIVLAIWRASLVAAGGSEALIAGLGHFVPAANFLGFASVFAAVSFAIARILGVFREGGGKVQEVVGGRVKTLRMPGTAKLFIALMAMAMMIIVAAVVLHVIAGSAIASGSTVALAAAEQWGIWLEGVRRLGIALYLLSIVLGLATIAQVLRFQSIRIRELLTERKAA